MDENTSRQYDFDVAVTFAGEDREFVEAVTRDLKASGFQIFYDEDNQANLWGEELTEYFADVYEKRARFAMMFISKHYAEKPWTRLERRSVLTRALIQKSAYLLPVRLDNTPLPGVRSTIGYLDGVRAGANGVAAALKQKLGKPVDYGARMFNGQVPRTDNEVATLSR